MHARNSLALVAAAMAALALSGCGKASTGDASRNATPAATISGMVSSDAPVTSVALRDASDPASVRITTPAADGSFSFDATGLAPPFVLRAEGMGPALYTIVLRSGNADINGLTSAAVSGAMGGKDAGEAWARWNEGEGEGDGEHDGAGRIGSVIQSLRTVLKPLFDLYHVGRIGGDDDEGDASGMRALLRDVSFTVSNGVVTVTNRATGGVIFSGPLNDLASGVFHPENMPAGPGGNPPPPPPPGACTYSYSAWAACQPDGTQTRTVVSATPAGCTGTPVLSQACNYVPPVVTCTGFTYSAWTPATCPASGQQTRTVLSATPTGCTGGNPVLTQTCTPPPPPPPVTCTGFTYSAWTPATCPASGQQTRTVVSATPAGCTGGNPVLTQTCTPPPPPPPVTCTGFTYSAWTPATCPASGQQTRTVVSATPAGCTGGNPVLTQTCTPPPPPPVTCTSFTYSAWTPAVCPASGQQTRTVVSALPAGCTGGSPVLTQTCTPPPPPPPPNPVTAANIVSSCTACHGLTSNNTVYKAGGYSKKGATSAQWLSTVNSMVGMGATLAPGTTAQNYADFLANAP